MLQIIDWPETFENAKSRSIENCTWVPVPNRQGRNYRRLLKMPSGATHYGVFIALVLVCSRQQNPRQGWLTTDGTSEGCELSLRDLSNLTFIPVHILKRSIEILSTEIGWLHDTTVSSGDTSSSQGMRIKNRTEQKELKEDTCAVSPSGIDTFVSSWNCLGTPFSKIYLTPGRRNTIRIRLSNGYWCDHWATALGKMQKSPFCRGENNRHWVATFKFFTRPDTVARLLEGEFDDKRGMARGQSRGDKSVQELSEEYHKRGEKCSSSTCEKCWGKKGDTDGS